MPLLHFLTLAGVSALFGFGLGWNRRTARYIASPAGQMVAKMKGELNNATDYADLLRNNYCRITEQLATVKAELGSALQEAASAKEEAKMLRQQVQHVCESYKAVMDNRDALQQRARN